MHYLFFDAAGDPGLKRYPDVKKNASPRPFYVQCIVSTDDKEAINQKYIKLKTFWLGGLTLSDITTGLLPNTRPPFRADTPEGEN